jgi:hypothetical protein
MEPGTLRPYVISDDANPWLCGRVSFGFSTFGETDRVWDAVDATNHRFGQRGLIDIQRKACPVDTVFDARSVFLRFDPASQRPRTTRGALVQINIL